MVTNSLYEDVAAFHWRFGIQRAAVPTPLRALGAMGRERRRHLREELDEHRDAMQAGDVVAETDALIDLVYVALGTLVMQGIDGPRFARAWAAVHAANMRKTRAAGDAKQGKGIVKPPGWEAPDVGAAIA